MPGINHARRSRPRIAGLLALLAAAGTLVVASPATTTAARADTAPVSPTPPTVSADPLPTMQIDGVGWTQVTVGNTVYVGGRFDYARASGVAASANHVGQTHVYNLVAYDITTGKMIATFIPQLNGQVNTLAVSPDQKTLYAGGAFTTVNGASHPGLAAFNIAAGAATAALITTFTASVSHSVNALAASATSVYAGGLFAQANQVARRNLAAFNLKGQLLPWMANTDTVNSTQVSALVLAPDGSRVIAGGDFNAINGTTALSLAALDATTGAVLPWAVNKTVRDNNAGSCVAPAGISPGTAIDTLSTDGTSIYGGGWSYYCGNFEGTFKADPDTGVISWLNDCHGDTYSAYPIGAVLYSASHAHDCSIVGSFPEASVMSNTPAPGYWKRALAEAVNPVTPGTNGVDPRGGNGTNPWSLMQGLPDTTVLDWVPNLGSAQSTASLAPPGTVAVSGWAQAALSVSGNANYLAVAGEMPTVGGLAQQGLTRYAIHSLAPNKVGPEPTSVITPTATLGSVTGSVSVKWKAAWDRDNQTLTYAVLRDGAATSVYTTTALSTFWQLPALSFTDTAVTAGAHSYQVRITDPDGNSVLTQSVSVTVPGTPPPPPPPPPPGTDLALNKAATDSSNYSTSTAARAVDGNTDGVWSHNSVVLTGADQNAWWQVDLGAPYAITEIDLYNRTDGSYAVMSDYWVFVSTTPFNVKLTPAQQATASGVVFARHLTMPPSPKLALTGLGITRGEYVMVQQNVKQSIQLAEVVVQ